jgi:hypothetical protein
MLASCTPSRSSSQFSSPSRSLCDVFHRSSHPFPSSSFSLGPSPSSFLPSLRLAALAAELSLFYEALAFFPRRSPKYFANGGCIECRWTVRSYVRCGPWPSGPTPSLLPRPGGHLRDFVGGDGLQDSRLGFDVVIEVGGPFETAAKRGLA